MNRFKNVLLNRHIHASRYGFVLTAPPHNDTRIGVLRLRYKRKTCQFLFMLRGLASMTFQEELWLYEDVEGCKLILSGLLTTNPRRDEVHVDAFGKDATSTYHEYRSHLLEICHRIIRCTILAEICPLEKEKPGQTWYSFVYEKEDSTNLEFILGMPMQRMIDCLNQLRE